MGLVLNYCVFFFVFSHFFFFFFSFRGVVNAIASDCENIAIRGSIIYCIYCRRILGYIDENNYVHLHNVRLLQFEPVGAKLIGDRQVQITKFSDVDINCMSNKRKYPIDSFDILDEPALKRRKIEQCLTVARVQVTTQLFEGEENISPYNEVPV